MFNEAQIIRAVETTASRLLQARTSKGLTQTGLAKLAGVSQGTVGNIEAGLRNSPGSLPKLAEALGVSHKWLRGDDVPMQDQIRWPFPMVPLSRLLALPPTQQSYVQGKLAAAIEECEAKNAESVAQLAANLPSSSVRKTRKGNA